MLSCDIMLSFKISTFKERSPRMIRFTNRPEEANAITHAGKFHADDVFAIVLLEKIKENLVIYRVDQLLEENIQSEAIVFDIGYGNFDHHQKNGNGYHEKGNESKKAIPYAAFGLLWNHFGMELCEKLYPENPVELWKEFEHSLVLGIDAIDNGIYPTTPIEYENHKVTTISNLISGFNDIKNPLEAIAKAIEYAKFVFDIKIKLAIAKLNNKAYDATLGINIENIFSQILLKNIFSSRFTYRLHHEPPKKHTKKLPIPKSSFGKVWSDYGKNYAYSLHRDDNAPFYIWNFINDYLITGFDAYFNGIVPKSNYEYVSYDCLSIMSFLDSFNFLIDSSDSYYFFKDKMFEIANVMIDNTTKKAINRIKDRAYIESKIKDSQRREMSYSTSSQHILVLDKYVHWSDWIARNETAKNIWFVIYPSNRGGFEIRSVPFKQTLNGYRKGFPRRLWGLNGDELKKATNLSSVIFVHATGFTAATDTLEDAIKLAELSFNHEENMRKDEINWNTLKIS